MAIIICHGLHTQCLSITSAEDRPLAVQPNEHPMQDVPTPALPKVVGKSKSAAASDRGGKRARAPVKPKPNLPAVAPYIPYVRAFAIGDHVSHLQFGEGTVTEIDGRKLTID